jgi:hypothetical protein
MFDSLNTETQNCYYFTQLWQNFVNINQSIKQINKNLFKQANELLKIMFSLHVL